MAADASVKNIDHLRQFGGNLKTSSENLTILFQKLRGQMHQVCEGWNDSKNQAFMADFEQKVQIVNKLSHEMQQYAQFIMKTCEVLEMYKNVR